ncbi:hypothetical protein PMIN06_000485 [Paraphaeosphaeria minitans]
MRGLQGLEKDNCATRQKIWAVPRIAVWNVHPRGLRHIRPGFSWACRFATGIARWRSGSGGRCQSSRKALPLITLQSGWPALLHTKWESPADVQETKTVSRLLLAEASKQGQRVQAGHRIRVAQQGLPYTQLTANGCPQNVVVGAKFQGKNVRVGLWWNFGRPVEGREKAALCARISHKSLVSGAAHDKPDQTAAKDGEIHLLSESGQWSLRPTPDTRTGEQTPGVSDFDASDLHYGR